jgi:hypothetical protein
MFDRSLLCSHGNNILVFLGGSLADVISINESQMTVMSEPELKLLLCQVSQVSEVDRLQWYSSVRINQKLFVLLRA